MKCCDIHGGMLRTPVTFERRTNTPDGSGGYTQSWAAVSGAPTIAFVKPVSGSERMHSQRLDATVTLKVTVRFFDGLLESDRVVIRGKNHNIRFIDNLEFMDKWLVISVDGGVA